MQRSKKIWLIREKNQSQPNSKLYNNKIIDKKIGHVKKRHGNFKQTKVKLLKWKPNMQYKVKNTLVRVNKKLGTSKGNISEV